MNKKLVIALVAVIIAVAAGATAFAVAFTASEKPVSAIVPEQEIADENGEIEKTEGEGLSNTACEPEKEYTYLRGTMYKNLYETKYQNLVETTKAKEPCNICTASVKAFSKRFLECFTIIFATISDSLSETKDSPDSKRFFRNSEKLVKAPL